MQKQWQGVIAMKETGKSFLIEVDDKIIHYHNQASTKWTHPYLYRGEGNETLHSSGCGIFSLCHAVEWINGTCLVPEEMADFAMKYGGRGNDGTDRPQLLHAMMENGLAQRAGFRYAEDGLRNDLDVLFEHIYTKQGVAFCNLRAGHIVTLVKARVVNGLRQFLVIDSVAESARDVIRSHVCEVIKQSKTKRIYRNAKGDNVGKSNQYAMFYVDAALPRDFSLLHEIR